MKRIHIYVLLVISFLFLGCDVNNKTAPKNDTNASKQESKSVKIPLVTTDPLDELDLSLYKNDGYTILGSHTWMENKTPTGIVVLGKQGEDCHICKGKIYAIAFQYNPNVESDKKWKITNETRFEELGSGGKPADGVIFLKLSANNFGFATLTTESGQGYYSKFISIYALVNHNFSMLGNFTIQGLEGNEDDERHLDDKGSLVDSYGVKLSETTADIFMDVNASKSFYNVKVKKEMFQPRKINSSKPVKQWEETYIFQNGKYNLAK